MTDNIEPQEVTQPGITAPEPSNISPGPVWTPFPNNPERIGLYGWACPICHWVWALWVRGCDNCNRHKMEFSAGTNTITYNKQEVKQ